MTNTRTIEERLGRARMLNVILGVVSVFLLVVVLAQTFRTPGAIEGAPQSQASHPKDAQVQAPDSHTDGTHTDGSQTDGSQTDGSSERAGQPQPVSHLRNDPNDPMAIGSIDAPVVIAEWTDFRCPYCALFAKETLPVLIQEYVDQGKLRIEFNDVAFFGADSEAAAVAARAAGAQGKYNEFMHELFAAAPGSGHPEMPREKLVGFASAAGVPDLQAFEEALDSDDLAAQVQASQATAQQLGVSSVPFFAIGNQGIPGAQPLETFRQLIDAELGKS